LCAIRGGLLPDQSRACMKFEFYLTVRGYELDSFGHVNNSVYLNYIEQAQWEMLRKTGTYDFLKEGELVPAIIEITIRYIREARLFDEMVIRSRVVLDPPYVVFHHSMYNTKTKLKSCQASVKHLYLTKERVACDLPDHILEKWGIMR
jgi:YbgC/YbaW family acyl-CoA thioester hydrolase